MCGYFGNLHECPAVISLLNQLRLPLPYPVQRAYQRRVFDGLVTNEGMASAIWWYALSLENETYKPNEKITSFNARDLHKPLWRNAITERRALVFATELGESKGKDRYHFKSEEGFALGCVYKTWQGPSGNSTSFSVITRPPHERFSQYHDKSVPMFLPLDADILSDWLLPGMRPSIQQILETPKITCNFEVTKVKSYKNAEALGFTERLVKDG